MAPPRQLSRVLSRWRCSSCRSPHSITSRPSASSVHKLSTQIASFSLSSSRNAVGPTSPKFFDIPEPPQQDAVKRQTVKGKLPTPQDIFRPSRGGVGRLRRWKLRRTIPPRTRERGSPIRGQIPLESHKLAMASMRRENLVSGMKELLRRRSGLLISKRWLRMRREAQNIALRAEVDKRKEEDKITLPSAVASMLDMPSSRLERDEGHAQRVEASKANVAKHAKLEAEERSDALHTMYMHARNFIVNEEQLVQAIDQQFGSEGQERVFGGRGIGIWEDSRMPDTIKRLNRLNVPNPRGQVATVYGTTDRNAQLSQSRLRRLAESMTGGKM